MATFTNIQKLATVDKQLLIESTFGLLIEGTHVLLIEEGTSDWTNLTPPSAATFTSVAQSSEAVFTSLSKS